MQLVSVALPIFLYTFPCSHLVTFLWQAMHAPRNNNIVSDGSLLEICTKVQGDNRGSFIVVAKRLPNMSKNPVSTVVLVKLVAIFDHQVEQWS